LWEYFLITKSIKYRKAHPKELDVGQSLPVLTCISNLLQCGMIIRVIVPEEIVMLLDDELAKKMDDGIFAIFATLNLLIRYDPSLGRSVLDRILYFQKVSYNITTLRWQIILENLSHTCRSRSIDRLLQVCDRISNIIPIYSTVYCISYLH
jgi:hypothetical protein